MLEHDLGILVSILTYSSAKNMILVMRLMITLWAKL